MSNSSLVTVTNLSPNNSGKRTHAIDRITPHCFVGQVTAARGLEVFVPKSRQASCNYVIGYDGSVGLCVDEANRSWCSSSGANDQRAITIECASDNFAPYAFKDACYNKLVDLCVDICQRNGKNVVLWFGDKNKTLNYNPAPNEMVFTVHRWFAATECPGNWMYSRMGQLANDVNAKLNGGYVPTPVPPAPTPEPTPQPQPSGDYPAVPFLVDITSGGLPILKSAGGASTGKNIAKGTYTITKVDGDYGYLKSGAGWIQLNASQVKIRGAVSTAPKQPETQKEDPKPVPAEYVVQVTASALNYREGPGTNYKVKGVIRDKGRYTIVDEQNGWGLLKAFKKNRNGWISLNYTKKI